ncbi:acetylxylan esterase [bacterium]|nr:acetylxylan esterase [bacterium]
MKEHAIRSRQGVLAVALVLAGAVCAQAAVPKRYDMPFTAKTNAEAVAWQKTARARLLERVAAQEPRVSTRDVPLDLQVGKAHDQGAYFLFPCSFRGNGKGRIRYPARLCVPKGAGPHPAMLCLHGHSGSYAPLFDPKRPYHAVADRFARGGYVVLAPSFPHKKFAAMMLWDLMRCVDILASRPEVDPARIGVGGLSMGGEWTMWLAACDERPRVAVVSGWMCTTEGVFSVPNCKCWCLPGFVGLMDVCEVHLLIAPRPLLCESAERDGCFPVAHTKKGFARIRAGYEVFGVEGAVRHDVFPGTHEWHGSVAYPFVDQTLGGHATKPE